MTKELIARLAATAVAVREKRAAMQKTAEFDIGNMLSDVGGRIGDFWGGLSAENKGALIGTGLGGAYGYATSRPGHSLEDTAFGAGVGGLGGYATGMAFNQAPGMVAPPPDEKMKGYEKQIQEAQARNDQLPGQQPELNRVSKSLLDAGNALDSIGLTPTDAAHGAASVYGAAAGGRAGTDLAVKAIHKLYPDSVTDNYQPRNKATVDQLGRMGIHADLKTGEGFPEVGKLPHPQTAAGKRVSDYDNTVSRNNNRAVSNNVLQTRGAAGPLLPQLDLPKLKPRDRINVQRAQLTPGQRNWARATGGTVGTVLGGMAPTLIGRQLPESFTKPITNIINNTPYGK